MRKVAVAVNKYFQYDEAGKPKLHSDAVLCKTAEATGIGKLSVEEFCLREREPDTANYETEVCS